MFTPINKSEDNSVLIINNHTFNPMRQAPIMPKPIYNAPRMTPPIRAARRRTPPMNEEKLSYRSKYHSESHSIQMSTPDRSDMSDENTADMSDENTADMSEKNTTKSRRKRHNSIAIKVNNEIKKFANFSLIVRDAYWGRKTHTSLTLDIIAIYLKGQKILYIESKTLCEQRLHTLMLPAIFISAACTVLSMSLTPLSYGSIIVSALTAINSFILSVINFLKLDAKAEAHKTSSYRFDKLQTQCEFYSGKLLFLENKKTIESMETFVETIEKQVEDIKDTNQFVIPEEIRYRYPNLYSINIFSEVKRLRNEEKVLRNKLFTLFNQEDTENDLAKKEVLQKEKEYILDNILKFHEKYIIIDDSINKEINDYINKRKWSCLNWLKT